MPDTAVSASAKGASFLILLQIGSRAITFALNQILLRFLSPELLGTSVQLELYKIGVQYFSRESLRVAAERRSDGGVQASVNLSYLAIAANIPLGFAFALWYRGGSYESMPYFTEALHVNQLAAFVELLMEPAFTAVQQHMLYKARATAEGLSVILKTLTVFSLFIWARRQSVELGVLPFAVGELVNSITLTSVYWTVIRPVAREKGFSLFPRRIPSSPQIQYVFSLFSKPLLYLIGSLFFQTGIKWLLTEGDKILIATLASLEDQGMYALSANYGGLIARMIFQPIEISSRNLFANLCASTPQAANGVPAGQRDHDATRTTENISTAASVLHSLLRVYTILALFSFTLGPTAAPLLLRLVAGTRWSDSGAGDVLGTYCYYIPFLAINGVSEAFVAATASTKDLRDQSLWMAGFSVLFAWGAWVFVRYLDLGARGLVFANCVNMALRIAFNLGYVKGFFGARGQEFKLVGLLPNIYAIAIAMAVPSVLLQVLPILRQYGLLGDLVRVGVVGTLFTVIVAYLEEDFLIDCYRKFRS